MLTLLIIWIIGIIILACLSYFFSGIWDTPGVDWKRTIGWPIYVAKRLLKPQIKKLRKRWIKNSSTPRKGKNM